MQPALRRIERSDEEQRAQRKAAALQRAEERLARNNARLKKKFGLILTKEGDVTLDIMTIYGFAYQTNHSERWSYQTGSFLYLYGIYLGLSQMSEFINEEIENEEDQGYLNCAFFILDKNGQPISILEEMNVPVELTPLINSGQGSRPISVNIIDLWRIEFDATEPFVYDKI